MRSPAQHVPASRPTCCVQASGALPSASTEQGALLEQIAGELEALEGALQLSRAAAAQQRDDLQVGNTAATADEGI